MSSWFAFGVLWDPLVLPLPLFLFTGVLGTSLSTSLNWSATNDAAGGGGGGGGEGGLGLLTVLEDWGLTFCESGLPDWTGKCWNCPFTLKITEKKAISKSNFNVMSEKSNHANVNCLKYNPVFHS